MVKIKLIFFLVLFSFILSCTKEVAKENLITEKDIELQMIEAYKEGVKELKRGVVLFAA